jgi:hypothetical protein
MKHILEYLEFVTEKLFFETKPDLTEHEVGAKELLRKYLTIQGSLEAASRRYVFTLVEADENNYGNFDYTYALSQRKSARVIGDETIEPDEYYRKNMADFDLLHPGGRTGYKLLAHPKNALETIPENSELVYRGMSWEEWQFIRKHGYIESNASKNIGDYHITYFGATPGTGVVYASSGLEHGVTNSHPGVVVAISRSLVEPSGKWDGGDNGEYATDKRVSINDIEHVYIMVPTREKGGHLGRNTNSITLRDMGAYISVPHGYFGSPGTGLTILEIFPKNGKWR